jgi:hypothetical protein
MAEHHGMYGESPLSIAMERGGGEVSPALSLLPFSAILWVLKMPKEDRCRTP